MAPFFFRPFDLNKQSTLFGRTLNLNRLSPKMKLNILIRLSESTSSLVLVLLHSMGYDDVQIQRGSSSSSSSSSSLEVPAFPICLEARDQLGIFSSPIRCATLYFGFFSKIKTS